MLSDNRGFTLLESLVAASILAIAVTSLLQIFSINLRSLVHSEDYVKAYLRAEEVMKEVCLTKDLAETSQIIRDPDGTTVLWELKKVDIERTKDIPLELFEITVRVTWNKDRKERSVNLTTFQAVNKKV